MAEPAWRAAVSHPAFQRWQVARFLITIAIQAQGVAIGWQVFELTGRELDLGYVGLAQFLTLTAVSFFAGSVVDRFDRARILVFTTIGIALSSAFLFVGAELHLGMAAILASIAWFGAARAFTGPAVTALLPELVSKEDLPSALAVNSAIWQIAAILGPAVGGAIYALLGATGVYAGSFAMLVAAAIAVASMGITAPPPASSERPDVLGGVWFIAKSPVLLGAMSLDLFAVLLGGATALLPVLAKDMEIGPIGLGVLRSSPAIGAAVTAIALARRPMTRRTGPILLACVAIFGLATIGVGLSRSFVLTALCLVLAGSADMVSVVVRSLLMQTNTPSAMRGRVGAVGQIFIVASNELGEFESGMTAAILGSARAAVALGGVGTLAAVAAAAAVFPQLRRLDRADVVVPGRSPDDTARTEAG